MPESQPEPVSTPSSPPPRRRKGGGAKVMFVVLVVLALAGVIVYLLSLLNSKNYLLAAEGGQLVVKKGIFFPVGSERYRGKSPEEAKLYAPIDLPSDFRAGDEKNYPDLASLNRDFAKYLIQMAEKLVFQGDEEKFEKGKSYLMRVRRLHGLDPEQLESIQGLVADVSYLEGKRAYLGVEHTLEQALDLFEKARQAGTGRFRDAGKWIERIESLLAAVRLSKSTGEPLRLPGDEEDTSGRQKASPAPVAPDNPPDLIEARPRPGPEPEPAPKVRREKPAPEPEPPAPPDRPTWRPSPPSPEEGI